MADRETLLALAARCEAAEGPSREMDELIVQASYPELDIRRDGPDGTWRAHGSTIGPDCILRVLDYTASLDAALTLVPEGAGIKLDRHWTTRHDGPVWMAAIYTGLGDVHASEDRPTPALALCCAALRARAGEAG